MGDMGGHENGNGNGNGNAKGKGKEPMEPPLEGNNFRIPPPSPEPPKQCPRCFSTTTKFCYFNNRSASQPRYFCKSCKRYWTLGGALRNIPIGGSSRKGTKKMTKGDSSSGSLSSCSSFYVGESSRVREHHSPLQHPQPPQPTTPSPLPAHMRAFSNDGLSFSSSFSLQGGIFSSFARLQNLSHSQGFNQVPLNGGGNIGGASGIQGARATNFSLFSGRPNLTGPPQIQQPVYQSNNRQQAMAHPNRPLGSLAGGLINHPSGSNINATLAGNNNVPGSDSAMNYQYQWCDEFYVDDVEDLFSRSSPPPPPS